MRSVLRFRLFITLTAAMVVALATLAGAPAGAADGPAEGYCRGGSSGPICKFQYVSTTKFGEGIDDGDGIRVVLNGEDRQVRLIGINAMEHHTYGWPGETGECHALKATERLRYLIDIANDNPGQVRLAARSLNSTTGNRLRRSVAVKINGTWQDVGTKLVEEGHVLPHINNEEWAWNHTYRRLAQQAAAKGVNLWDTDYCNVGPRQEDVDNKVDMYVHWDAEGVDGQNINNEFVRLRNRSDSALDIGGWWLRDSDTRNRPGSEHAHGYTFPSTAKIPAHGQITFHVGRGDNGGGHFYFDQDSPIFDNVSYDNLGIGDGAYLFDKGGDLRKWQMYPCEVGCTDPLAGKINVTGHAESPEHIAVKNTSDKTINLVGHRIVNDPYSYPITGNLYLRKGETLRLYVLKGKNTRLKKYWGKSKNILDNGGDVVSVRTFDDIFSDCHNWGDARGTCP